MINIGEILYVPNLKKNVISVIVLEDKGFSVTFSEGNDLVWTKGESIRSDIVIGVREGDLYKVSGHVVKALLLGQCSNIKREPTMPLSPQQGGVA